MGVQAVHCEGNYGCLSHAYKFCESDKSCKRKIRKEQENQRTRFFESCTKPYLSTNTSNSDPVSNCLTQADNLLCSPKASDKTEKCKADNLTGWKNAVMPWLKVRCPIALKPEGGPGVYSGLDEKIKSVCGGNKECINMLKDA